MARTRPALHAVQPLGLFFLCYAFWVVSRRLDLLDPARRAVQYRPSQRRATQLTRCCSRVLHWACAAPERALYVSRYSCMMHCPMGRYHACGEIPKYTTRKCNSYQRADTRPENSINYHNHGNVIAQNSQPHSAFRNRRAVATQRGRFIAIPVIMLRSKELRMRRVPKQILLDHIFTAVILS